jgi:predicted RecA/RadA family phage recombinase
MRNYIKSGDVMTFTAPGGGVVSGQPYLIGATLVIATTSAAATQPFEGRVTGVYSVAKAASQAWVEGAIVYWDNTARNFTTTVGSNTKAGIAAAAVGSGAGETTGLVRLNGSF